MTKVPVIRRKVQAKCNLCGKPLTQIDLAQKFSIHRVVGYGSAYDMSEIRLRMCCECFDAMVDGCEVSPVVKEGFRYGYAVV